MKVIVIYGSANDQPYMKPGLDYLVEHRIPYEEHVLSMHRDTEDLFVFLKEFNESGEKAIFITVAGLSATLPGFIAVKVDVPVIGVPVPTEPLNGMDALLSMVQCPGGVPLTSVGIHKKAPVNACMYAHRIINLANG